MICTKKNIGNKLKKKLENYETRRFTGIDIPKNWH